MQRWLLVFCLLMSCGCSQKPSNDLTAEELALALGAKWWSVQIPPGHDKELLCVTFADENGPIDESSGVIGSYSGGEVIKFFLFDTNKETIRYSMVGKDSLAHGEMPNRLLDAKGPDGEYAMVSRGSDLPVQLGDFLYRAGPGKISSHPRVKPGEIGITLMYRKE